MRLISWNVNGRVGDACRAQVRAVLGRAADVVALQELTVASYPRWCEALLDAGYSIVSSVDLLGVPYPAVEPPITRRYFNAVAAGAPIAAARGLEFADADEARFAFPEKHVAVRVALGDTPVEVHCAHLPPGSTHGILKLQAFAAIRRRTDRATSPVVLCGDFNTPQREDAAGVTTWASSHRQLYDAWDDAERLVLENPRLRDVYRERHDPAAPFPASHYTGTTARRYDHVYASVEFKATSCTYHVDWLRERLSDHAAVEADLKLPTTRSPR
jgi:endonuclease/exonuclease/phosphatase family metal-dependent hydrolase